MKKIFKSNSGAAAIEFAFVAPLLFVLLFGIIEFASLMYNQAVITNASREGARYASNFYTNPANATATRVACSDVQNYVVTYVHKRLLNFVSTTPFDSSNVLCCSGGSCTQGTNPSSDYGGYVGYVGTVQVRYQYDFLVLGGMIHILTGGSWSPSLTLNAATAMRDENQT